jgi:hypothetical protein
MFFSQAHDVRCEVHTKSLYNGSSVGRDSVACNSDLLRAGWSGDRYLGERDFLHLFRLALEPTHRLYNAYRISFPGVGRLGRGVSYPPLSSAEVKKLTIPLQPLWACMACSRVNIFYNDSSGPKYARNLNASGSSCDQPFRHRFSCLRAVSFPQF